jgi:hypothetical protein
MCRREIARSKLDTMFIRTVIRKCKSLSKFKIVKHNNPVQFNHYSVFIKKIFGLVVNEFKMESDMVSSQTSQWGLLSCLCWYAFLFYCVYKMYSEDQTILRKLYDTRLNRYGEEYERIITLIFVLYAVWKLAFKMYGNTRYVTHMIEIDNAVKKLGVPVDYNSKGIVALLSSLSLIVVYLIRTLSISVTLNNLSLPIAFEKIYQVVFCDALSLVLSAHYCYHVLILKERYRMLNGVLRDIKEQKAWEYTIFVRDKPNKEKANQLQEKYICQKLGMCAQIYSMIYDATGRVMKMFGFAIILTSYVALSNIVLYIFYFMEATATGLFNDVQRYMWFLMYTFWQAGYSLFVVYILVYYSDNTVNEVCILMVDGLVWPRCQLNASRYVKSTKHQVVQICQIKFIFDHNC